MSRSSGRPGLHNVDLPLRPVARGKVRNIYAVDDDQLLIVASDRVSAFDVVMSESVPRKGEVLTMLTAWWLERLGHLTPHHLISAHPDDLADRLPALRDVDPQHWSRRSMLVHCTTPLPVECVARGYLSGSAWKEYRASGTLAGEPMPEGLVESARLPEPIFSPATKAHEGHDENIRYARVEELVGAEAAERVRQLTLALYAFGIGTTENRGLILADTKFEFGWDHSGRLRLIDEVMTPDSSRFWPQESYAPGRGQPSLDKQPLRDYLETLDWDKGPPPPTLPPHVVEHMTERYLKIFRLLTGAELDEWHPRRVGQPA